MVCVWNRTKSKPAKIIINPAKIIIKIQLLQKHNSRASSRFVNLLNH